MRWLRGGSLQQALERGPWNLETASRVLSQVASGLAYAHRQGVVHRDVKPANVLLDEDGNAYLSDFGIAARLVDSEQAGGRVTSSPAYLPPEALAGEALTFRSDVYGLGLLTFELLAGQRPPMDGALPSLHAIRPELAPALDEVVACATAADANERYESAQRFVAAFAAAVGTPVAETYTPAENPYKGLEAFGEADAADFYGRDALVGRARTGGRRTAPGRCRRAVRNRKVVGRQGRARPRAPQRGHRGIGAAGSSPTCSRARIRTRSSPRRSSGSRWSDRTTSSRSWRATSSESAGS